MSATFYGDDVHIVSTLHYRVVQTGHAPSLHCIALSLYAGEDAHIPTRFGFQCACKVTTFFLILHGFSYGIKKFFPYSVMRHLQQSANKTLKHYYFIHNQMKKALPYIAIVVAMLFWSTSTIATKIGLKTFAPLTLVTLRFGMAVVLMLAAGLLSGQLQKVRRKDIPLFLLAGFAQPFCYFVLESYGIQSVSSPTMAEVILSTSPLFAPLFAFVLIRERVTWQNIVGILISTAGVVMMIVSRGSDMAIGSVRGLALLLGAVFTAVIYTILLRKIPGHYNSLSIVFYVQLSGLLFFIPTFCMVDLPHIGTTVFSWQALAAAGYLALFPSVVCFILFCYTVRQIGVTRANAFNNLRPVFTALFMLCFFGEHLPLAKWIAIGIVIAGLFIAQRK